jgi:hypothetical protein
LNRRKREIQSPAKVGVDVLKSIAIDRSILINIYLLLQVGLKTNWTFPPKKSHEISFIADAAMKRVPTR